MLNNQKINAKNQLSNHFNNINGTLLLDDKTCNKTNKKNKISLLKICLISVAVIAIIIIFQLLIR